MNCINQEQWGGGGAVVKSANVCDQMDRTVRAGLCVRTRSMSIKQVLGAELSGKMDVLLPMWRGAGHSRQRKPNHRVFKENKD